MSAPVTTNNASPAAPCGFVAANPNECRGSTKNQRAASALSNVAAYPGPLPPARAASRSPKTEGKYGEFSEENRIKRQPDAECD